MLAKTSAPTSLQFFSRLQWLDGTPLLDTIEPYRRDIFRKVLDTYRPDGAPIYNMALCGRGKKNWKSCDLVLAALYCLVIRRSPLGNDGIIVASDEGQAGDDLQLARKLVEVNPDLLAEIEPLAKALRLRDGSGSLKIIPGRDVAGAHGKTYAFLGIDELHTAGDWSLLEALAPDPHRPDALTWITSYDTIYNVPGVPLYDLKQLGKAGGDPRLLFSWYSGGELCTDPAFTDLDPERRANPSMGSWADADYLEQQRRRLPTHKFRRLHLNLPGAPEGAFFDQGKVMAAIVVGRVAVPYQEGRKYFAFVDMSGGSADDSVLAIGHDENGRAVLDLVVKQAGEPPFNPRQAVRKFVEVLRSYRLSRVMGDNFAGRTFAVDFEADGISYDVCSRPKTELYEQLEPALNAGEVELLDEPKLQEQLLTLVVRGTKIDHENNSHDDWANAAAGCVWMIRDAVRLAADVKIVQPYVTVAGREVTADDYFEPNPWRPPGGWSFDGVPPPGSVCSW
jgi:phage terminase large subunit-like protein